MAVNDLIRSADQVGRAVVISLFTWRRAESSDPVDDSELYGYWGDAYPAVPKDRIGSRLWLLRRRSLTDGAVQDAQRYAQEALDWMAEDGVVQTVDVFVDRVSSTRLSLRVLLTMDGDERELVFDDVLGVINAV